MSDGAPLARFRFHEELNDFLAPQRRERRFEYRCARDASVKHAIEALGVPHTEVALILVDGHPAGFGHRVHDGNHIDVYPRLGALEVVPPADMRPQRPARWRFIADAHLGGLARLLRMAGFDTLYENGWSDDAIRQRAQQDGRILLTRDRELLKVRTVTHGCYVHATDVEAQFAEVVARFGLAADLHPFSRCLRCNLSLAPIAKEAVIDRLPERVAQRHDRFSTCPGCRRIYWEGGHWVRMRAMLERLLPRA